jgi:hypothetical protein
MPVREREEVQEMLWRIASIVVLLTAALHAATLLPEQFGVYRQAGNASDAAPADPAVWKEFGFTAGAESKYTSTGNDAFTLSAWRFEDPTGAFAAFQSLRPDTAVSAGTSASLPDGGSLVLHKNYVLRFAGGKPHPGELTELYGKLPETRSSSLPPLTGYLPVKGRVPNSERYVLGPAGLERFVPGVDAGTVSFQMGPEAQSARYRIKGEEVRLTIFSYPTPQMAIAKLPEFAKLPDTTVRRSGPMIVVASPKAKAAETLLTDVNYNPKLTWNEYAPKDTVQDAAQMILAIMMLALILIVASVFLGFMFGGFRVVRERLGFKPAGEEFTSLHLQ